MVILHGAKSNVINNVGWKLLNLGFSFEEDRRLPGEI